MPTTSAPARPLWRSCRRLASLTWRSLCSSSCVPRFAVVGSGPAGFFVSSRVLSRCPEAQIDMYEALPVPFGLVRYGVAPDHPEVKNCQVKFFEIAQSPNFCFIGNVSVGLSKIVAEHCTVQLETLMRHYNSIVLAYGASDDRQLSIPGELSLDGVWSARQFVGWYNGHPHMAGLQPDLSRGENAIIIGHGNVAMDLARMLLTGVDTLKATEITEHALSKLASSRIKNVRIVGRRGPMQAAFTIKEVRELINLPEVSFQPIKRAFFPNEIHCLPRASRRLVEVLMTGGASPSARKTKSWSLESCLAPKRFLAARESTVTSTEFNVMSLVTPFDRNSPVIATRDTVIMPSDLVLCSIGYNSAQLSGLTEVGALFDKTRGTLLHDGFGRVMRQNQLHCDVNSPTKGASLYCAGWVKTGSNGVIGATMQDAFITADALIQDWHFAKGKREGSVGGWKAVEHEIGPRAALKVSWDQWQKIDEAERARGKTRGKPREKFTSTTDMLTAIG